MKMNKKLEISDCKDIVRFKNEFIYCKNNILIENNIENKLFKEHSASDKISKLFIVNGTIIAINNRGQLIDIENFPYSIKQNYSEILEYRISSVAEERYVRYYTRGEEAISGLYDTFRNKIIFESNIFFGREYFNDYIFEVGSSLIGFEISTKDFFLKIDASEINEVLQRFERILIVKDEIIYLTMSDGTICSINMKTNKFKTWKSFDEKYLSHKLTTTERIESFYISELGNFSKNSATYLKDKDIIVGFEYGVYWELDLQTELFQVTSMSEEFEANDVSGCWSGMELVDNILYFFSDQAFSENQNHKIVGFDLNTKKVVCQWGLPKTEGRRGFAIKGPKFLKPNFLAAFEQNSTCHLFEIG